MERGTMSKKETNRTDQSQKNIDKRISYFIVLIDEEFPNAEKNIEIRDDVNQSHHHMKRKMEIHLKFFEYYISKNISK
jgi:hypothetical protein